MNILDLIGKFIGVSARVGGVFALAAVSIYAGKQHGVKPFATLDPVVYQAVMVLGVVGLCAVFVEVGLAAWKGVGRITEKVRKHLNHRRAVQLKQETGLKNLASLSPEQMLSLFWLKKGGVQRFQDSANNPVLMQMVNAFLLEIDDPGYNWKSTTTYFRVPSHIWTVLDNAPDLGTVRLPPDPPWRTHHLSWMAR